MPETSLGAVAEAAVLGAAASLAAPAAPAPPAPAIAAPAAPPAPVIAAPETVSAVEVLETLAIAHPGMKAGLDPLIAQVKAGVDAAAFGRAVLASLAAGQKLEMQPQAPDNSVQPPKQGAGAEAAIDGASIMADRAKAMAG